MCFAPQRRALFRHLNFQKCFEPVSLLHFLTSTCSLCHNGTHFFDIATSKSGPNMRCLVHFGVQFFISHLASWLRTRRFSEPSFRPCGVSSLLFSSLLFSSLLFPSPTLPISAFHLSAHIVGSLTSQHPSAIYIVLLY